MKITWIGHSCFKIEQEGYTLITDPYEDGSVQGLRNLREKANKVLCSHEHGDHNARSRVTLTEAAACPFKITVIDTYHDDVKGAKRGPNKIHIIEADGVRVAHFGDLGCSLTPDQIEKLKGVTVCLIPVGGFFTIDGKQAAHLIGQIAPRTVVPMHFRDDKAGFGFDVIDTVDTFAGQMGTPCVPGISEISTDALPEEQVVILTPRDLVR